MSALAIAMFLTGAGATIDEADQRRRPPIPQPQAPPPTMLPPVPPPPAPLPPPPPPPRPLPQRQVPNLGVYFTPDDYPAAALRANEEGSVGFRLLIERDGQVAHCQITRSSGSAALDVATCQVLRARARYNPARDADGNAVRSIDRGRVSWVLPVD